MANDAVRPRRLIIAPSAVGCKPMFDRPVSFRSIPRPLPNVLLQPRRPTIAPVAARSALGPKPKPSTNRVALPSGSSTVSILVGIAFGSSVSADFGGDFRPQDPFSGEIRSAGASPLSGSKWEGLGTPKPNFQFAICDFGPEGIELNARRNFTGRSPHAAGRFLRDVELGAQRCRLLALEHARHKSEPLVERPPVLVPGCRTCRQPFDVAEDERYPVLLESKESAVAFTTAAVKN
jgi:hypothetical protein